MSESAAVPPGMLKCYQCGELTPADEGPLCWVCREKQVQQEQQHVVQKQQAQSLAVAQDPSSRTNVLAIVALVTAFFIPLIGFILGLVANSQIAKTGERGKGMAIWAMILGFLGTAAIVFLIVVSIKQQQANEELWRELNRQYP